MTPALLPFDPRDVKRAFERHIGGGWQVETYGPRGALLVHPPSRYTIVVSADDEFFDGVLWIHASIANRDRDPSYQDLKVLHGAVFGDRHAFQIFTPPAKHINIHPHALHLWGRADGVNPLPEFGDILGSI